MKSSITKDHIENLIPVLSEKEKQEMKAYYTVYEKHSKEFSAKAAEDLKNHPVFEKLIRDIPKEVSKASNKASNALQKDAIINDNWKPHIEYQIEQGITYAKMGLNFKSWYEVISLVRNFITPYLRKEYGSGAEYLSAINGMNNFMDITMGIIGEAYVQEKEETLRSNEVKLKQAQAIAHIGNWDIDFATNIGRWSEEACRIHGLLIEENKQSFESWLSFIHPEDLEYVKKEIEKSNASLSDTILNHRIMRKDGTVRNIYSVSKFVLNHEGKPIGLYGIAHDVTEQKIAEEVIKKQNEELEQKVIERTTQLQKSEELFSNIFNNSPVIMVISNLQDGTIKDINHSFMETFGLTSKEEVIGKTAVELNIMYHPEQRAEMIKLLKENKPVNNFDISVTTKQNELRWLSTSVLLIEVNNVPHTLSVSTDITNRKKSEEQLQDVNKELEAFSYSISHDLRAPLRAINGFSKILQEDYTSKLDADGISTLDAIMNNSKKMGILIDDLLAFSRLGRKEISTSEINMTALVKSVKEEELADNTNEIEFLIHALPPAKGDQALIKQVWVNLISNAIKYSKHKPKPNIEIGSYSKDHEIIYFVKDNGVGFDMQYYDKLFGVFQRLHSSEEFEGTGVGLAIVQKIVDRHNGTVWAESKLNEETCFYFSLPNIKS